MVHHCIPQTCNRAIHTISKETVETQSSRCHLPNCKNSNKSQKVELSVPSKFCDSQSCKNLQKSFSEAKSAPNFTQKETSQLRICLSFVVNEDRVDKGRSDYEEGQKVDTPGVAVLNKEVQTYNKSVKIICGKPRTSIHTDINKIIKSASEFSEACEELLNKCKIFQNITLREAENCKNKVRYCISPSVFRKKASGNNEPQKIINNEKLINTNKPVTAELPSKPDFCTEENCVAKSRKIQQNKINTDKGNNNSISEDNTEDKGSKIAKNSSSIADFNDNKIPVFNMAEEVSIPDCCTDIPNEHIETIDLNSKVPIYGTQDCCRDNLTDEYSIYSDKNTIYPYKDTSLSRIVTLTTPECCKLTPGEVLQDDHPGELSPTSKLSSTKTYEAIADNYQKPSRKRTSNTLFEEVRSKGPARKLSCCIFSQETMKTIKCFSNKEEESGIHEVSPEKTLSVELSHSEAERTEREEICTACLQEEKEPESPPEPIKRPYCDPTNCEKLNVSLNKWKSCCDKPKCPINDPTTSTYAFLLKTRLCCNRRACQLAAKICDIYEPLVNVEMDIRSSDDLGEDKYHFLGVDADTNYEAAFDQLDEDEENNDGTMNESASATIIKLPDDAAYRESIYIDPEGTPRRERRASTVSWSVPPPSSSVIDLEPELSVSASTEQVIAQATAAAKKFRQTPQSVKHTSVFGDIVKKSDSKKDPAELTHHTLQSQDVLFKSQLDDINLDQSKHKANCCASLKKKFKRKKKNEEKKESDDEFDNTENYSNWRSSFESDRKRTKLVAVEEKTQEINKMLNSM